jgi:hypothetical protein
LWQPESHPIQLINNKMAHQKLDYIHYNPVEAGFVTKIEEWKYSGQKKQLIVPTLRKLFLIYRKLIAIYPEIGQEQANIASLKDELIQKNRIYFSILPAKYVASYSPGISFAKLVSRS